MICNKGYVNLGFPATILNMLKLLSLSFFVFFTIFCKAQGIWNIGYIQIDSINKNHIGQVVRIDFKSFNPPINSDRRRHIRSYIGTKDIDTITIDKTLIVLAERRKIYVDHGNYNDKFLECINCKKETILIYDAKILEINSKSILFQLDIETKKGYEVKQKEIKVVTIDRKKLDGVMYKL